MASGRIWSYDGDPVRGDGAGAGYSHSQVAQVARGVGGADRIGHLKSAIDDQLRTHGVYQQIQGLLAEMGESGVTSDKALAILEERGIIEKVIRGIREDKLDRGIDVGGAGAGADRAAGGAPRTPGKPQHSDAAPAAVSTPSRGTWRRDPLVALSDALEQQRQIAEAERALRGIGTRRFAHVQLLGGKAFLEHTAASDGSTGPAASTMQVHACFRGQRFASMPLPYTAEPAFNDMFLFEIGKVGSGPGSDSGAGTTSTESLLRMNEPIHLVVTRHNTRTDRTELVGTHALEWRHALCTGSAGMSVEVAGPGTQMKVPVGLLEVRVEILPRPTDLPGAEHVEFQLRRERSDQSEWARKFYAYAHGWWQDFNDIRDSHATRNVSLFALTEGGVSVPVTSFVKPLLAGRLLDSSLHACRMVSLLPAHSSPFYSHSHDASAMWSPTHTVLARHTATPNEKAMLLASLLLGFGLDAYVCMGRVYESEAKGEVSVPHAWVVTLDRDGKGGATHWDAVSGYRMAAGVGSDMNTGGGLGGPWSRGGGVGCLFNHQHFYANIQPSDSIDVCSFDVLDRSLWKSLPRDVIEAAGHSPISLLSASVVPSADTMSRAELEMQIEEGVSNAIAERRAEAELSTVWDDRLSYLLTPALAAYENDCLLGCPGHGGGRGASGSPRSRSRSSSSNPLRSCFEDGVKGVVPDGHTFKAFPVQYTHTSVTRMLGTLWRTHSAVDIVDSKGDEVRFGVRSRVFVYPDHTVAAWLLIAVTYRETG